MRRLTMFCCSMCLQVGLLSAAPSPPILNEVDDRIKEQTIPEGIFDYPLPEEPDFIKHDTPASQMNIFVAATMDSSIAITTLIIIGVIVLLMIQVTSTIITFKICKNEKCSTYSTLLLLCVPFVIIISGIVFLFRKSPAMPLT